MAKYLLARGPKCLVYMALGSGKGTNPLKKQSRRKKGPKTDDAIIALF